MSCFCFLHNPLLRSSTVTKYTELPNTKPDLHAPVTEEEEEEEEEDDDALWSGTWKQIRVWNLDDYMKNGVGVNWFVRRMVASENPTEIIKKTGDCVVVEEPRWNGVYSYEYTIGHSFNFPGWDGKSHTTHTKRVLQSLEWTQTHDFGVAVESRSIDRNEMTLTSTLTRGNSSFQMIRTFRKIS